MKNFKGNKTSLDFTYPFLSQQNLQKQRLTLNSKNAGNKEVLKVHKLTITVQNTRDFNRQLKQGLEHYINEFAGASAGEKEDIEYIIEDLEKETNSDFYKLRDIVNQETLGKLKKQAQINYLEFLHDNINIGSSAGYAEGAIYLQDLIRRLKLIEEYINDTTKADGEGFMFMILFPGFLQWVVVGAIGGLLMGFMLIYIFHPNLDGVEDIFTVLLGGIIAGICSTIFYIIFSDVFRKFLSQGIDSLNSQLIATCLTLFLSVILFLLIEFIVVAIVFYIIKR